VNRPFFGTPQEAEAAFYRAFSQRDLVAMMGVWADGDDIVCIHPGGQTVIGNEAIRKSWAELFQNAPDMQFVVAEKQRSQSDRLAVHVVHEHIRSGGELARGPILATNVYRLTAAGWRMVLHHASPGSSETPPPERPQTLH
jgi:ketosteroid isomerase-like protein